MIHLTHSSKNQTQNNTEQEMKNDFFFFFFFCSLLAPVHQQYHEGYDGPFRDSKMTLKIIEPVFFLSKTGSKIPAYLRRAWKRSSQ